MLPRVEVLPIEKGAVEDELNVNKHTQKGMKLVENSLTKRGAFRSIASAGKGVETPVIYAGNLTHETAMQAGFKEIVNVHVRGDQLVNVVRDDIEPGSAEAIALGLEDNESGKQSYNPEIDMLSALAAGDNAVLATLRNEDKVFGGMLEGMGLKEETEAPEPQIDKAEELRVKWGVETGQLWKLGEHRLICGDCTDKAVVDRVMQGEKAELVWTDPPYGVDYDGGSGNTKKRDKLEGDESGDLYLPGLMAYKSICVNNAPMYVWFASSVGKPVYDAVDAIGYKVRAMIVWNKIDAHYGAFMAQYMQKHEPCLYIVNGNANWIGPTNEVTVWDVKQPSKNEFHPTEKPVDLAHRAIGNHKAEIVADFFLGSGTTLIACEQLGRKCRAIEISPAYVAVALQRWSDLTGGTPELVKNE
jgi:DNA modification methylase